MSNIDKRELLGVQKHANQHRLSRLTMEVHTDELRIMASAVESYTDELIAALEAAEKHIAELRDWNAGLAQESFTYQQRVAELESALKEIRRRAFSARRNSHNSGPFQYSDLCEEIIDATEIVKGAGIGKGE